MGNILSKCVTAQTNSIEKLNIGPSASNGNATTVPEPTIPVFNGERPTNASNISRVSSKDQSYYHTLLAQSLHHEYEMHHKKRGTAFIFNHEKFNDKSVDVRKGTAMDSINLQQTFKSLNFDVKIHNDLTLVEIKRTLGEYAAHDHSEEDCVAITILSHGQVIPFFDKKTGEESHTILAHDQLIHIHARDTIYPLQMIFKYLTDENCKSLKGKPRLFFIQACQGNKSDAGFTIKEQKRKTERDSIGFKPLELRPVLPQDDYLIAYSSLPGFYSFRNETHGSWFIRELCKELNSNDGRHDLLGMLTYVIQTVAYDYESKTNQKEYIDQKKQIPCVCSMLKRLLYFPKVINQGDESP